MTMNAVFGSRNSNEENNGIINSEKEINSTCYRYPFDTC